MALVALDGTPLVEVGALGREGVVLPFVGSTLQDAANEACIMIGQLFWTDGGSHTVNTTGSSSLGWKAGAITFANAGTTFKVGLAAVDTATGPPGRAVNSSNVITFDVVRSYTSAAIPSVNVWNESVPTSGTKTIAHGDLIAFCTQVTARGGSDAITTQTASIVNSNYSALVTSYVGGTYTAVSLVPLAVVTASDGTRGFFWGGHAYVSSIAANLQTWNNTSGTKEYGNFFQLPFPAKIYGIAANVSVGGNLDLVLYSNPLVTPVAEKTHSIDLNTVSSVSAGANRPNVVLFSSPYSSTASQPLAAIMKPTSATDVDAGFLVLNSAAYQNAYSGGTNCYAVNRNAGAFASQNSGKDRYGVALLVGAFDAGGGGGGRAIQVNDSSLVS